jgi:hypothetical protein
MMKKMTTWLPLGTFALILAACGGTTSSTVTSSTPASSTATSSEVTSSVAALTSITIGNANDVEVEFDADFNLFTGVTALGDDGVDYADQLTISSISTAVNATTGELDTTKTGVHTVRYLVTVGDVSASKFRNVTVAQPDSDGLLVNPDFALGTAGWDDPSVVYIADGAAMTLSTESGELKAEVTAGANFFTPRFGQMNIPFVQGTTYEVSFDARSSVTKEIALQVGELLPAAPYFVDFLPLAENIIYRTITTTTSRFSYKFTMNQDNPRGGILFGLGRVNNQSVNATLYFDNVSIVESTIDADTTAPAFFGVQESVNLLVGATYDPRAGVTALDVVDGDVTADIIVEILDSNDQVVQSVDTAAPGSFTVNYSVEDAAGNEATASTEVNVVDLVFKDENLLTNGSFGTELGAEWGYWQQDWGTPPVVTPSQDVAGGTYSLDIVGGGDAAWAIQLFQDGVELVEGTTYRFSVTASATVARKISVGIGYGDPWNEYGRLNGIDIGTTSSTQEFVFTVTKATADVKVVLELGTQEGFADGTLVLEEVRLQRLEADALIANNQFDLSGWRGFANTWDGTAFTAGVENGEFAMTVTAANISESWHLQIVQDAESLAGLPVASTFLDIDPEKTYTLSFDAYATEEVTLTPNIFGQDIWTNHVQEPASLLTTSKQTFTKTVSTVGAATNDTEKLAFEFGTGLTLVADPITVYLDNVSLKEADVDVPSLYNGDMETVLGGHTLFGDATMKQTADGALITTNSVGGQAYEPHYFYILPNLGVGTYELKFVVTSSVTRDLRFNIVLPDAGYASILEGGFSDFGVTEDVAYTFTATIVIEQPITNVKMELDFGTLGGDKVSLPGEFLLSEVLLYRNFNA